MTRIKGSISRRIIDMMGGEIGVEIKSGVGSVFSFLVRMNGFYILYGGFN